MRGPAHKDADLVYELVCRVEVLRMFDEPVSGVCQRRRHALIDVVFAEIDGEQRYHIRFDDVFSDIFLLCEGE